MKDNKKSDIITGELRINKSGSGFISVGDDKELYIYKNNINKAFDSDIVSAEIIKNNNGKLEGKVVDIISRNKVTFVGTIQVSDKFAFMVPDSNKMYTDIFVPLNKLNGAKDGQKVVVEFVKWEGNRKTPNGKVVKILGNVGDNDTEIHSILEEYGLPYEFGESVEKESEKIPLTISQEEIDKRRDMRTIKTITIDPETAKDFDDAISYEKLNDNEFQIGIHIADVSHYVRSESELDIEAYERGTSVYLVDRVVPMLPERLSNGVCSLRPNEDKLCFSAIFTINTNGDIYNEWFGRTIINSNHRYTYEEAQTIIETREVTNELDSAILQLDEIAKTLRRLRLKNGSIVFDKREIKFKLDENLKPIDVIFSISKDANKLVEEFMLLANVKVAEFLKQHKVSSVNRVHEEPDILKLGNLKVFLNQYGYNFNTNSDDLRGDINKLLMEVKGTSEENIVNNLVIRSMQKAIYSTNNYGHYGLGFDDYTHFTSPIRRYSDVMVHRILNRVLSGYKSYKEANLSSKCSHLSSKEVRAQKASRDSIKFKQAEYMSDKIGRVYDGVIVGVSNYGLFVEIKDTNCDGFVKLNEISGDFYESDINNFRVVGKNTGNIIRLGDDVVIIVKSVDVLKKVIDLNLLKL